MTINAELQRVSEIGDLRGFSNLFYKENCAWWGTRRWWVNALVWPVILCGLLANMLFMPTIANLATEAEIARAGSLTAHIIQMGLSVFFEFGLTALAIGIIVVSQGLVISEKQNGAAEWLLSKPVTRRAYVLAKLAANVPPILLIMISLPSILGYTMLSLRMSEPFPVLPFLSGVGIMILHSLFYFTLTLALGTLFSARGPLLGIALGSILGGNMLGGLVKPLLHVTPWALPKLASLAASSQSLPDGMGALPLAATGLWCLIFILIAIYKFERMEF